YLQTQHRGVERRDEQGRHTPVDCLETAGAFQLAFDEAVPREAGFIAPLAELLTGGQEFTFSAPGGEGTEELPGGAGRLGRRRRRPVEARTLLRAERLPGPGSLHRLRVRTENRGGSTPPETRRDEALRHALIAAHTFIGGEGLAFLSSLDPPEEAAAHVGECR